MVKMSFQMTKLFQQLPRQVLINVPAGSRGLYSLEYLGIDDYKKEKKERRQWIKNKEKEAYRQVSNKNIGTNKKRIPGRRDMKEEDAEDLTHVGLSGHDPKCLGAAPPEHSEPEDQEQVLAGQPRDDECGQRPSG